MSGSPHVVSYVWVLGEHAAVSSQQGSKATMSTTPSKASPMTLHFDGRGYNIGVIDTYIQSLAAVRLESVSTSPVLSLCLTHESGFSRQQSQWDVDRLMEKVCVGTSSHNYRG